MSNIAKYVIDDALFDIDSIRTEALNATYKDFVGSDGGTYQRVSESKPDGLVEVLGNKLDRKICHLKGGYRLNYKDELPNCYIHSDDRWAAWATVLYLDKNPPADNGTAFWKHKSTGLIHSPDDFELATELMNEWNMPEKWELYDLIEAKYNRAAVYKGSLFHSRYPFEGYGSKPEDGRLIYTGFFNAKKHIK